MPCETVEKSAVSSPLPPSSVGAVTAVEVVVARRRPHGIVAGAADEVVVALVPVMRVVARPAVGVLDVRGDRVVLACDAARRRSAERDVTALRAIGVVDRVLARAAGRRCRRRRPGRDRVVARPPGATSFAWPPTMSRARAGCRARPPGRRCAGRRARERRAACARHRTRCRSRRRRRRGRAVGHVVEPGRGARLVDLVVAGPAARGVVAGARIDRVVARAAVQRSLPDAARERVGTRSAVHGVVARSAVERVVGARAGERVVARTAARALDVGWRRCRPPRPGRCRRLPSNGDRDRSRAARVVDRVAAVAAREHIAAVARRGLVERVVAIAARDVVVAGPPVSVSSPRPPVTTSLPAPASSTLSRRLPVSVSLPDPPVMSSTSVPMRSPSPPRRRRRARWDSR